MNKILIILEMANNHMGNFAHGKKMIDVFAEVAAKYSTYFDFAWKFQFRDLNTFIHKSYKNQLDHKYVKRFTETALTAEEFNKLKDWAEFKGFSTLCTGFDENSIDLINEMNFPVLKVASCSFGDWPLMNKIASLDKPIILSTAGSSLEEIDRVASFFIHRNKNISLLHCVGEYPTQTTNLQLNQIDILKQRYPNIAIGYSTHEEPTEYNSIQIAIAKGATIIEKHVALRTLEYEPNNYSATPEQIDTWLLNAVKAIQICGITNSRFESSAKELADLKQFKRGVFVKKDTPKGTTISKDDLYCSWPSIHGQFLANDLSKYNRFVVTEDIKVDQPLTIKNSFVKNTREEVYNAVQEIKSFLRTTNVVYPGQAELELSHHYGIHKFKDFGITMITVVNREYCKKLIIVLPNQTHPEQYHKQKEETFLVLYGQLDLTLNGVLHSLTTGDVITIEPTVKHQFVSKTGCIIEEISSTHHLNDSYYTDNSIHLNQDRKTFVTHWI